MELKQHKKQQNDQWRLLTRQVYNLFQDLLNRFPYFEGLGVGAKSIGAKAAQAGS